MDVLLDNKRKKLFDEAYQAYINITRQIEDMYCEGMVNPFDDGPSVMVCSLDLYLQGCLLKIAVSDGTLSPEELYFITALPDEYDEVCARNRGYRRFIKLITVERFNADYSKFYDFDKKPSFLEILEQDFDEASMMVRSNLQIIFDAFIAIDGVFSECEADTALEILDKIDDGTKEFASSKEDTSEPVLNGIAPSSEKEISTSQSFNRSAVDVLDYLNKTFFIRLGVLIKNDYHMVPKADHHRQILSTMLTTYPFKK
jgi:hypothetical protein